MKPFTAFYCLLQLSVNADFVSVSVSAESAVSGMSVAAATQKEALSSQERFLVRMSPTYR